MVPATAASPPNMGDASGGGSDFWAATWHDSGKMNVSSGSSNRSAVSSPPAVNPFTGVPNLTQLNTSPWPISSGTSPVSQPTKNHQQQPQQQRNPPVPPRQQQPAQPQATFTPQWPPSSSSSSAMNDPFNISNVTSGGGWRCLTYVVHFSRSNLVKSRINLLYTRSSIYEGQGNFFISKNPYISKAANSSEMLPEMFRSRVAQRRLQGGNGTI